MINGKPFSPLMWTANNQFGRDAVLLEELRMAAAGGLRLFSFVVSLDWHSTPAEAAATVDKFCAVHPEGYFYVRVWLGPNRRWLDEHPDHCITKADGTRMSLASPSSELWHRAASRQLAKRVREIINGPHADRFLGVLPTYLQTGEWFYPDTNDYMDYSPVNLKAFRAWLARVYEDDAALQRAWGDETVSIETADLPGPEMRNAARKGIFRDPVEHRPAIDMQRFQSDLIAETVELFAKVVKETTDNRSLAGAFFGYTMELNNNGPRALAHSGHLSFAKVLECNDIDMIHAPYSYYERKLGQPAHFHLPIDSVALHGKLAIMEDDTYTHLARPPGGNQTAPGWRDRTKNLEETMDVVRRNFGMFMTHRCGAWYFDLLSDGRWLSETFWNSFGLLYRIAAEMRGEPPFRPEVAFIADEESAGFLRDDTRPLLLHTLSLWRAELDRTGTPAGYYLASDLSRLPDSVKVLILANSYRLSPERAQAVNDRLERGATVIWVYAPGVVENDRIDFGRISKLTGIDTAPREPAERLGISSELTGETVQLEMTEPIFEVTGGHVDVVARYTDTNEIAAAARPWRGGVSLYTATPRLPTGLLREVFRRAGVHLYHDKPAMTGVMGPYLTVHTDGGLPDETIDEIIADMRAKRPYRFQWPRDCSQVIRIVPLPNQTFDIEKRSWTDRLNGAVTAIYKCR